MSAQYSTRAGVDTYTLFGEEAVAYATEAASVDQHFGIVQTVTPSARRNLVKIRGLKGADPTTNLEVNPRDVQQMLAGKFEGDVSVDFQPQHFKWLQYVLGSTDGAGTSASKANYPRAATSSAAEIKELLTLPSMSISTNFEFGGAGDSVDKAWTFLGCKVSSCTIKAAVGEPLTVSMSFQLASVATNTTLKTQVALDSADVYYFVGANVEYPTSTPIPNIIEGFELSITNELSQLHGCGTGSAALTAKESKALARDYSLKLNLTAEGSQFMDDFLGSATTVDAPTEIASVKLTFVGDTNHTCDITCYNIQIDDNSRSQNYPEVVKENPTLIPKSITVEEQFTA